MENHGDVTTVCAEMIPMYCVSSNLTYSNDMILIDLESFVVSHTQRTQIEYSKNLNINHVHASFRCNFCISHESVWSTQKV